MDDKVVVITGASAGIGAALAELAGKKGWKVVLAARREPELRQLAARVGAEALPVVADVSRREDVRRIMDAALARFGQVDVWVNNAGRGITRLVSELTDEDLDEMMRVNVKSALYGMQAVLPHFRTRGAGHILNVSSMLGRIPYATPRSSYCGAKHFLNALTAAFRDELRLTDPGITISLVSPGVVYTSFGENAVHGGLDSRQLPDGQSAEEVVEVMAGIIESRDEDVYTRRGSRDRVVGYYASLGSDPR